MTWLFKQTSCTESYITRNYQYHRTCDLYDLSCRFATLMVTTQFLSWQYSLIFSLIPKQLKASTLLVLCARFSIAEADEKVMVEEEIFTEKVLVGLPEVLQSWLQNQTMAQVLSVFDWYSVVGGGYSGGYRMVLNWKLESIDGL